MYVYIESSAGFTVGFYDPSGEWIPESDHDAKEKAAARVNFLNGGSGNINISEMNPVFTPVKK